MLITDGSAYIIFKDKQTGKENRRWDLMQMSYNKLTEKNLAAFIKMAKHANETSEVDDCYLTLTINAKIDEDEEYERNRVNTYRK